MAQSLDAQVGVAPPRRQNVFEFPGDELETSAQTRGVDVFRLVVALSGLAAFVALPAALIFGVALLVR
jgi:hypothetical protein